MKNSESALHILVVDDEQGIREGAERILIRMGFTVSTASRGADGLEIIYKESVHIVFLISRCRGWAGWRS